MKLLFVLVLLQLLPAFANAAGYRGAVAFTEDEKRAHLAKLPELTAAAQACLQGELDRHKEFITKYGVSAFYGDQSKFARHEHVDANGRKTYTPTTVEERRQALANLGFSPLYTHEFIPDPSRGCTGETCQNMMQPTSCIGITLKCLSKAFRATGQTDVWTRINKFTRDNGSQGDALIDALQKLGWKVYYWSPDVRRHAEWDAQEQREFPGNPGHAWGQHVAAYASVTSPKHNYYLNTVDDWTTMTNFGTGIPSHVSEVPFFVGIAHLGYHVFPGSRGMIIEGHSSREITDAETVQRSPFSPIRQGGGPNAGPSGAQYHSGIVAVPPGY